MAVKEHQIYAADRKSTAPGYEGSVTVFDVQVPQVKRISGEGNRKLTIWFSEAIELSDAVLHYKDWKLDGWGAAAAGLQTVKILRAIDVGGQTFGSGLELYFGRGLAEGNHVLEIAEMDSLAAGSRLFRDGAGYRLENKRLYVSVQGAAGPPAVKVERTEGHAVYLRFDRPMYSNPQGLAADASDPASVLNVNQYTINSVHGSVSSAEFIEDSDRKSVKLVVSSDILATGVNLITYGKSIEDLFGLRLVADSEGEDLRQIFTVEEDNRKPMAEMVEVVNPSLIRVTFSEQVNGLYALNKGNYVLKDRNGASIPIDSITAVPESNMYEIRPSQDLYGDGYTLKIMTIPDMAIKPNFMDTVLDKGNYRLIDGDTPSNYKALPAGTRIETGPESRSAVITLPSAYLADA
jgi:hypothetical protein